MSSGQQGYPSEENKVHAARFAQDKVPAARSAQYKVSAARSAQRPIEWERLRSLVVAAQDRGLGSLSEKELWELPSLYRKALSDLSLMRSGGAPGHVVQEMNQLCNKAHSIVYRGVARRRGTSFIAYILHELPRTVRRRAAYIWAAAATMTLFAVLGWMHCELNPALASNVLSPQLIGSIESSLAAAREQADLGLAAQIPREARSTMALLITINNIKVAVYAFVLGIAGGLITLIILGFNGYMLGAVAYLYFNTAPGIEINLPLYFIAGIAPHGVIELPAICLAGAAGMLLGFSWLFPGRRPRGEALREASIDAGRLVLTCALTLLVAGMIEGFVTPLLPPTFVSLESWLLLKVLIGAIVLCAWLMWLLAGGRKNEPAPE